MTGDPLLDAAIALVAASAILPAWVALRWGGFAARATAGVWPAIAVGTCLLGSSIHATVRAAAGDAAAGALVLGLESWMLVHLGALAFRPRLRGPLFRIAVVVPGTVLACAALLAVPIDGVCALLRLAGAGRGGGAVHALLRAMELAPIAIAALGVPSSLRPRRETVRLRHGPERPARPMRVPVDRVAGDDADRPPGTVRIAQIADPHLGGLVTTAALRRMIERLVARGPDLVLVTGDWLAAEGLFSPGALAAAIEPLRALPGRCFAALGNHDHDNLALVREALASAGVRLLVDEATIVPKPVGPVEIVGVDDRRRGRRAHLRGVFAAIGPTRARARIVLLHDPARFADMEPEWADLVLAGHVHGGQVGLVSVGIPFTVLAPLRVPDHGAWALGACRMYVHRGSGTFGFPLRIGIPGEESVIDWEPPVTPAR